MSTYASVGQASLPWERRGGDVPAQVDLGNGFLVFSPHFYWYLIFSKISAILKYSINPYMHRGQIVVIYNNYLKKNPNIPQLSCTEKDLDFFFFKF